MQVCWSCKAPINTPEEKDYASLWIEREGKQYIAFLCKECYDKPEFKDISIDTDRPTLEIPLTHEKFEEIRLKFGLTSEAGKIRVNCLVTFTDGKLNPAA